MRNGYFQLVAMQGGYGLKLVPPVDGGEVINIGEVMDYLDYCSVVYDLSVLKNAVAENVAKVVPLGQGECPVFNETYKVSVAADKMSATVRFLAPSATGKNLTIEEFIRDMRHRQIVSGMQIAALQEFFMERNYCEDIVFAKGKEPGIGRDAEIKYYFNTDIHAQPTLNEDGSVDFFNLNAINHCKKDDLLAEIIPEQPGENGMNIMGEVIRSRDVKRKVLHFGRNIRMTEDRRQIFSEVDGHVTLVEDKVFVSDVYVVEDVDNSTGNIEFEGSVQVNGNVKANFEINAKGNVEVRGVVEGAKIKAGGNIIIARGMMGMGKGELEAGGNIIVKFLESATATADGYIHAESVLHSELKAGTEIEVDGKHGFITGGHVIAAKKIKVKTLGSEMGASTVVEVGINPKIKEEYMELQKDMMELQKVVKSSQTIVKSYAEKKAAGARFNDQQLTYFKQVAQLLEVKKKELALKLPELERMQKLLEEQNQAKVVVMGAVYPGTKIVIGDLSMVVQTTYKYCKFERFEGNVKMLGL